MIRLRQTKGADLGRELEFDQELIRIGRMPDSDVNFDPEVDLDASGRHAEIRDDDGRYVLVDTGSRNGTWLNGQRIKHAALKQGDEVEFGRGGPKLTVDLIQSRVGGRVSADAGGARFAKGATRFDPLAVPVTTATRLDDLVGAPGAHPKSAQQPPRAFRRRRKPSSKLLWAAAGAVLLAAIILVVVTFLR